MAMGMTETQINGDNTLETKVVRIRTSVRIWRAFEDYWRSLGKTTLAEGFRTAMEDVTKSRLQKQEKIAS